MDAKELKRYIYENDLLRKVLEGVGCHSIVPYSQELRMALPDGHDNSQVSVSLNENLDIRIFTKSASIYGSIYDLIMHIYDIEFKEAYKKCAAIVNVGTTFKKINKVDDELSLFKKVRKKNRVSKEEDFFTSNILEKYSDEPHIDLIRKDGIMQDMIDKYQIKFDERSNRIVFPHFKYDDKNKVLGLIGRTVNPAYESLKIPKYFSLEGLNYEKSRNLYGLSHNIENIKEHGYVIVFEAEKSVMKADMFGYPCGVSVGCHDLSFEQKKMLIALDVEIIIAFDKDVEKSHIESICEDLSQYRKASYIEDRWKLLKGKKDSPVDRGHKRFSYLFKHRTKLGV
ncbi:hypothetical protein AAXE64_07760 [Priestia megaterium]